MRRFLCLIGRHRLVGGYYLVGDRPGIGAHIGVECVDCEWRDEWDCREEEMVDLFPMAA